MKSKALVSILMGSDSDLEVMKEAAKVFEEFEIPYSLCVLSAHRTPERLSEYIKEAESSGVEVFITGAGGAAHLPGVVASFTIKPVIGIPIKSSFLDGLDSLLSIVQMPKGIPVATVGVNNAKNAGLLAMSILSLKYLDISDKLKEYRAKMKEDVIRTSEEIIKIGYAEYLRRKNK